MMATVFGLCGTLHLPFVQALEPRKYFSFASAPHFDAWDWDILLFATTMKRVESLVGKKIFSEGGVAWLRCIFANRAALRKEWEGHLVLDTTLAVLECLGDAQDCSDAAMGRLLWN